MSVGRWTLLLLTALALPASADSLRANITPLALRPRSRAPMIVDVALTRQGAGLLEGTLELEVCDGGEPLLRHRLPDLALISGAQTFRLSLPPLPVRQIYFALEVKARFLSRKGEINLGRFPLSGADASKWQLVIAVVRRAGGGEHEGALWQSLRLDRFVPPGMKNVPFTTTPVFLPPEDVPANPLQLCAFDVVLLETDGLRLLREKQLTALRRWVEAGGSLCIVPGAAPTEESTRLLRELGLEPGEGAGFTSREPLLHAAGLGRVAVASETAGAAPDNPAWRRAVAFLWKLRVSEAEMIASSGRWSDGLNFGRNAGGGPQEDSQRRNEIQQFLNTLLPQNTRLIPPATIALILGGFVLVIGPLDWFVLGWLRRRRWTWVLFPLASAGFTAITVLAAERAMGRQDHRAALTITDVGAGGRVLRASRFEMQFAVRPRESRTEVRNAWITPASLLPTNYSGRAAGESDPPLFEGQPPLRSILHQPLRQWTPSLHRVTSFEALEETAAIPWEAIETQVIGNKEEWNAVRKLAEQYPQFGWQILYPDRTGAILGDDVPSLASFVGAIGRSAKAGLPTLILRPSPDAAGDFGDLALLDPSEPGPRLLIVSRREPGKLQIFRRLIPAQMEKSRARP